MNTKIKTILSKLKSTFMEGAYRPLKFGALAAIGFFGTTLVAVSVTGTIKTWTSGEVLTATT